MSEVINSNTAPKITVSEQSLEDTGRKNNTEWVKSSRENISSRYDSLDKRNPGSVLNFLTSLKDYESMAEAYRGINESSFVDGFIKKIKEENINIANVLGTLKGIVKEMTLIRETLDDLHKEASEKGSSVELSDLDAGKLSILRQSSLRGLFTDLQKGDELIKNLSGKQGPVSRVQGLEKMYLDILSGLEK